MLAYRVVLVHIIPFSHDCRRMNPMLRIPQGLMHSVCFVYLLDREGECWHRGVGLFLPSPEQDSEPEGSQALLVTAGLIIDYAKRLKLNVALRVGTKEDRIRFLVTDKDSWLPADSAASGLAVLHAHIPDGVRYFRVPLENLATEGFIRKHIRVGTQVFLLSLFTESPDDCRNVPVLRAGKISALAEDPLRSSECQPQPRPWLVEMNCAGSLSGSPVFALYSTTRTPRLVVEFSPRLHGVTLVGLLKGHRDIQGENEELSLLDGDMEDGLVEELEPVQEVSRILRGAAIVKGEFEWPSRKGRRRIPAPEASEALIPLLLHGGREGIWGLGGHLEIDE
jgi:hypothetical protein